MDNEKRERDKRGVISRETERERESERERENETSKRQLVETERDV